MKAFAIEDLGQAGAVRDIPVPEPGEGQVRIRVAAAGLNPFDNAVLQGYLMGRMEHRFPLVLGMDASGTVDTVGQGVSEWAVGDEVFGTVGKTHLGEGTLAELATMSAGTIARKPTAIEHSAAAAIPVAGVTALMMVDAAAVSGEDVIAAIGATGGVGSYLVQLAKRRGARVVAICRGENADYARTLGAAYAIDYTAGDLVEQVRSHYPDGIHAIADMHGDKEMVARLAEQVRPGGHVASAVGAADAETLGQRGIEATNVMGRVTGALLETLASMLVEKEIVSPAIESLSLDDAGRALASVGSGHVRGKIIVVPS